MEAARPIESEPAQEKPSAPAVPSSPPIVKKPLVAGFLSLFPGIGNIYNGLYLRGILFFAVIASLLAMGNDQGEEHSVLGFVIAFVWIFNVLDAYRQAWLINYGYAQDLGREDLPKLPKAGQGGLLAGVLLLLLGIAACLQVYLDVDLSWILKFWPLGLVGIGGWLVASWLRTWLQEKRRREEAAE